MGDLSIYITNVVHDFLMLVGSRVHVPVKPAVHGADLTLHCMNHVEQSWLVCFPVVYSIVCFCCFFTSAFGILRGQVRHVTSEQCSYQCKGSEDDEGTTVSESGVNEQQHADNRIST